MKPGFFAGAMSMAAGEYISVASQRDTEQADVDKERAAQNSGPQMRQQELDELAQIYVERGLTERLAREVAVSLTEKDAVRAHARVRCIFLLPVCPLLQRLLVVYNYLLSLVLLILIAVAPSSWMLRLQLQAPCILADLCTYSMPVACALVVPSYTPDTAPSLSEAWH